MYWIFCCIIVLSTSLHSGKILTTSDFTVIERKIQNLDTNSLVLFDVDATLIVPDDVILKPKGKELFKRLIAHCTDRDLFRDIRQQASHCVVDSRLNELVSTLIKKQIPTIAFTAAPAKIRDGRAAGNWRVDELKRHGFDFSTSFPGNNLLILPKSPNHTHFPAFKSGVLFSSFHPKGDLLVTFLQMISFKPNKVVFLDDELEHVQSVVTSLEKHGIKCVGIHYTAANDMLCDLNEKKATFQVNYFIDNNIWLSDSDCVQIEEHDRDV